MKLDENTLERLRTNDPSLTSLELSYWRIDAEKAKALADARPRCFCIMQQVRQISSSC